MIRSLHHAQVSIPIGSENEARAFYCGVLGLTEVPKPDSLAGRGGFWVDLGDAQIHLGAEDGVDRTQTRAHVAYLVDDLDSWRSKLANAGCQILEGIPIPGYDRFEFRDSFGNRIEFLEER
ncbi:MAG: VOC family protein [Pyrinomonadaceae bacterium]